MAVAEDKQAQVRRSRRRAIAAAKGSEGLPHDGLLGFLASCDGGPRPTDAQHLQHVWQEREAQLMGYVNTLQRKLDTALNEVRTSEHFYATGRLSTPRPAPSKATAGLAGVPLRPARRPTPVMPLARLTVTLLVSTHSPQRAIADRAAEDGAHNVGAAAEQLPTAQDRSARRCAVVAQASQVPAPDAPRLHPNGQPSRPGDGAR